MQSPDAFPDRHGVIRVAVHHAMTTDALAILKVGDDDIGFTLQPENKRHGLGLVRRLVEQVGGSISLDAGDGALWTVWFPAPPIG